MEGRPFFEPTQELAFVKNVMEGRFTIAQLPTEVSGIKRWQIFSVNSVSEQIDSFNIEVGSDGLFNVAGSQLYTSPDLLYQSAVLERQPGECPFTGLTLIPVHASTEFSGSCLSFGEQGFATVDLKSVWVNVEAFTFELWIKPRQCYQEKLTGILSSLPIEPNSFQIGFDDDEILQFDHVAVGVEIGKATTEWQHIAVSYDGKILSLFLDGGHIRQIEASFKVDIDSINLGSNQGGDKIFQGCIEEVRIWTYCRSQAAIEENMNRRLIGDEPGLEAYFRCDEARGMILRDQTENCNKGILKTGVTWVASNAKIGDHPSIRRSSFSLVVEATEPTLVYQTVTQPEPTTTETQIVESTETMEELFEPGAIYFDGLNDYLVVDGVSSLSFDKGITFELWTKGGNFQSCSMIYGVGSGSGGREVNVHMPWGSTIFFDCGSNESSVYDRINRTCTREDLQSWTHWAFVKHTLTGRMVIYKNGSLWHTGTSKTRKIGKISSLSICNGQPKGSKTYNGTIAEVRIWNIACSQDEIDTHMRRRLRGDEAGLVVYYTFEEQQGSSTVNKAGNSHQEILKGGPRWEKSSITLTRDVKVNVETTIEMPVQSKESNEVSIKPREIDHSGPRTIVGGLSACLYYQQETTPTGYDGTDKPMKRSARMLLAVPTTAHNQPESSAMAVVDFAVSRHGRLALVPSVVNLPVVARPKSCGTPDKIHSIEKTLWTLEEEQITLQEKVRVAQGLLSEANALETECESVEMDIYNIEAKLMEAEADTFSNSWCRLKVERTGKYLCTAGILIFGN